MLLKWYKRKKN